MKLKQIEAILKRRESIIVFQSKNCQWLSDGRGIYPAHNLPKLTQENIFAMFDIPEQQTKPNI